MNDGNGFVFVDHVGDICPSGFLLLGFDKVHHFLPGYVLSNVSAHAHLAANLRMPPLTRPVFSVTLGACPRSASPGR